MSEARYPNPRREAHGQAPDEFPWWLLTLGSCLVVVMIGGAASWLGGCAPLRAPTVEPCDALVLAKLRADCALLERDQCEISDPVCPTRVICGLAIARWDTCGGTVAP